MKTKFFRILILLIAFSKTEAQIVVHSHFSDTAWKPGHVLTVDTFYINLHDGYGFSTFPWVDSLAQLLKQKPYYFSIDVDVPREIKGTNGREFSYAATRALKDVLVEKGVDPDFSIDRTYSAELYRGDSAFFYKQVVESEKIPAIVQVMHTRYVEKFRFFCWTWFPVKNNSIDKTKFHEFNYPVIPDSCNKNSFAFRTQSIIWTFDKTMLLDGFYRLKLAKKFLDENPDFTLEIRCHTDMRGNPAYNSKLSERRARSLVDHIVSIGGSVTRVFYRGYGEIDPIYSEATILKTKSKEEQEIMHMINRRTEFVFSKR